MKQRYNKIGGMLQGGKMIQRAGYKKGQFIADLEKLSDIILNGAQVEMKAQQVNDLKGVQVQVMEVKIYFTQHIENEPQP